ncbi:hypothetical protein [Owenweeksia hongkongensis]|uniref:hypothetical protein n=1 Tax=Owenweeksia hongkongensis TaxID=253245 RepID=UPI003A8D81DA
MKILIRVSLIIVGIFLLLWLAFAIFAEPFIKKTIEEKLTYYQEDSVSIGAVNIQFFPIGLKLKDAHFKLHISKDSLLINWAGDISYAQVGGIDWMKAWKENIWDVKSIKIGEGAVHWKVQKYIAQDSERFSSSGKAESPDIILRNTNVELLDLKFEKDSLVINLETSINLDSLSVSRKDSMQWHLGRVQLHSEDALFENVVPDFDLAYDALNYDSKSNQLKIDAFIMKPRITAEEFSKKYPFRKVQPDIYMSSITVSDLNINELHNGIFASKVVLDSCDFSIYQDLRKERENVRKPLPSELVANIPIPVDIDSLILQRAFLHYHHTSKKPELGQAALEVDELTLKVFPINNIGHPNSAEVNIVGTARLQKEATVSIDATLFADKTHHDFEVKLSMKQTPIAAFNSILYPTTGVKVEEGQCTGARVHMSGNDFSIRGDLDIAYTDLKVSLAPGNKDSWKFMNKVKSGLGNWALVNTNLTYDTEGGKIFYERPAKEPFVNFWWKGIQSGLLDAIVKVDLPL